MTIEKGHKVLNIKVVSNSVLGFNLKDMTLNNFHIIFSISILVSIIQSSCTFNKSFEAKCKDRPWTKKECFFFDSLQTSWKLDSIRISRANFNNCDETGGYFIDFFCDYSCVPSEQEFMFKAKYVMIQLHSRVLDTKVASVTCDYIINFDPSSDNRTFKLGFYPYCSVKRSEIEDYTGIRTQGNYFGKSFKRYKTIPTSDTLIL